jgi:hypothetical protein
VLGLAAAAAVAAAVTVTVSKGEGESPQHRDATAYIKSADGVQQQMQHELTKATTAFRDFAGGKIKPAEAPRLAGAERTLRKLQRRVRALPAPPVAARLRRRLIRLADLQVSLAEEVAQLVVFSPRFTSLIREVGVAGTQLSKDLAAVSPPSVHTIKGTREQVAAAQETFMTEAAAAAAQQADAVDTYDAKVGSVLKRLRRLTPPAVMRPSYLTQRKTLAATQNAGRALAQELRKTDRSKVAKVGRRFSIAARGARTVAAQRAEIDAVKAYNRRVRSIGAAQALIQLEFSRLQRSLG